MEPSASTSVSTNSGSAESVESRRLRPPSIGPHNRDPNRPSSLTNVIRASQLTQSYLSTGSKVLDDFLHGGIPGFGLTEISGEASSGKTQLCLQLTLMAQLPVLSGGLDAGSVYISTEQFFPSNRLSELSEHFKAKYSSALPEVPMDKVIVEHISDADALLQCIESRLPTLLRDKERKIRLIVLDSIAAVFRADYEKQDMAKRTHDLRHIGSALHQLCRQFKVTIVVVNQVSASLSLGENIPSLGLVWTNLVTTRLMLSRSGSNRVLTVKFAPHIPNGSILIQLTTSEGIQAFVPEFMKAEAGASV